MITVGNYHEQQKCPACSSERDKGGRLIAKKKKNWYLSCSNCRYSITQSKVQDKNAVYQKKRRDKRLFSKKGWAM